MAERTESRKRELLGEFAQRFLMAVGYGADEISGLVDLSRVDPAKVKELLHAKTEEAKKIEDAVKNPRRIHRLDEPLDD
jgi:hypothetical protein